MSAVKVLEAFQKLKHDVLCLRLAQAMIPDGCGRNVREQIATGAQLQENMTVGQGERNVSTPAER